MLDFNDKETADYSDLDALFREERRHERRQKKAAKYMESSIKTKKNGKYVEIGKLRINRQTYLKYKKYFLIGLAATAITVGGVEAVKHLSSNKVEVTAETNNPYDNTFYIRYEVDYNDTLWKLAKNSLMPGSSEAEIVKKIDDIKRDNGIDWDKDTIRPGDTLTIEVAAPCVQNFGYIIDSTYQTIPVLDQIYDKISHINYCMSIIDNSRKEVNIEYYNSVKDSISEVERIAELLANSPTIDEEQRMDKENTALSILNDLFEDIKYVVKDENMSLPAFEARPHMPADSQLMNMDAKPKMGLL